jgi:hypothetical protein
MMADTVPDRNPTPAPRSRWHEAPYRDYSLAELIQAEEVTRFNIAGVDTGEDQLGAWVVPAEYRALLVWRLDEVQKEIARRRRLLAHPLAPRWPDTAELDDLKARVDLVDFIEAHAPVVFHKVGRQWRCWCPLPHHPTPHSAGFTVDREKGVACCFGCGWSGNVFQFAMEYLGCRAFGDAVDLVAAWAGVERRRAQPRPGRAREGVARVG